MNIRTKLLLYASVLVLVPCVIAAALLIGADRGMWSLLVLAPSLLVAVFGAWMLGGSYLRALEDLTARARDVAAGEFASAPDDHTRRTFPQYVAQLVQMGGTLAQQYQALHDTIRSQQAEVAKLSEQLASAAREEDRMSKVLMEREYTMVQIKRALKEYQKRFGEEVVLPEPSVDGRRAEAIAHDTQAMLNVLEDLEEEKSLLATEKAKDEAILKSIGDGLMVIDARGTITFLNDHAKRLLGVSSFEPRSNLSSVLHGIYDAKSEEQVSIETLPLAQAMHGRSVEKRDLLVRNEQVPDGCYISMTAMPIMVSGLPMGAVATFAT